MRKSIVGGVAAAAIGFAGITANAAILTDGSSANILVETTEANSQRGQASTVRPGAEFDFSVEGFDGPTSVLVDVNADDDGLFTIEAVGNSAGLFEAAGTTTLTFTLPLTPGTTIDGFDVLSDLLTDLTVDFADNMLTLTFTETALAPGVVLAGRFSFSGGADAVPLPGAAIFMLSGLGALGLRRLRG